MGLFKLIRQQEDQIEITYKIKKAIKGSVAEGILFFNKKDRNLIIDKDKSSFYFCTLNLESIKQSLIEFDKHQSIFPNSYYLFYQDKTSFMLLTKINEDRDKVSYVFDFFPLKCSENKEDFYKNIEFKYYKADQSILLVINKNEHKKFIKYITLLENFFKQFNNNIFPSDFRVNIPD